MKNEADKRILVTSALPYANGPLHLGHIAGAYLPGDIYVRYQRLKNEDVLYICGSDEHGVPITVTADKEGISPQDVVDRYHKMNKDAFAKLGISFDHYSRTSIPLHHDTAREFFTMLNEKDDFVVKTEEQFYSEQSKRFLPDRYVEGTCPFCGYDNARGDQCDKCGKWLEPAQLIEPRSKIDGSVPVLKETKHWYLPMGRFSDTWKKWFESGSWKENVYRYCMGWYNEGLTDRPITRDLHWGVKVPLEDAEGKVLYVWFDAPIGYISATKEWADIQGRTDAWKEYWCDKNTKMVHFIGKDNIVFHAILFPMILMEAGGYVLPSAIPANEYLTIEGRKISTSQNYAIWVKDYLEVFPPDPLRYTLAANAPEGRDTDFSWKQFQSRNNDELADILGNFINRTLTFVKKYEDGVVPERSELDSLDKAMMENIGAVAREMGTHLERFEVRRAIQAFMGFCRSANKYFNDKEPWVTRKTDKESCRTTLNICVQAVNVLSTVMEPVLPQSARMLREMLNKQEGDAWQDAGTRELKPGHVLGKPVILFSKIEDDVIEKEIAKLNVNTAEDNGQQEKLSIDSFKQIQLKTATVCESVPVKGSSKLLQLTVDTGTEKRQVVAGIGQSYTAEELINKTVIVITNLKPAKIMGVRSEGMVLAVKTKSGFALLTTDREAEQGLRVE